MVSNLMKMSYNAASSEDLLGRSLSLDSNLSRAKDRMLSTLSPPVKTFSQCPNVYCKLLHDELAQARCQACDEVLTSSAGAPIETFSIIPLAASLQLLLANEEVKRWIREPRAPEDYDRIDCL